MKKIFASLALIMLTAACTPAADSSNDGMMCEKECCKQMSGKDHKMQCPMMKDGAKDGMECCCKKMMEESKSTKKPATTKKPETAPAK